MHTRVLAKMSPTLKAKVAVGTGTAALAAALCDPAAVVLPLHSAAPFREQSARVAVNCLPDGSVVADRSATAAIESDAQLE